MFLRYFPGETKAFSRKLVCAIFKCPAQVEKVKNQSVPVFWVHYGLARSHANCPSTSTESGPVNGLENTAPDLVRFGFQIDPSHLSFESWTFMEKQFAHEENLLVPMSSLHHVLLRPLSGRRIPTLMGPKREPNRGGGQIHETENRVYHIIQ